MLEGRHAEHYNYFRDYDPSIGRYVESDAIGLNGGINTYAYSRQDPIGGLDPLGLVSWSGTVLSGTAGVGPTVVGGDIYTLVSECKCGYRWIVHLHTHYFGLGLGAPWSYTGSSVSFDDGLPCPIPEALTGPYAKFSGGIAPVIGYSYSLVTMGQGGSHGGAWEMGIDFGASLSFYGKSEIDWKSYSPCNTCKAPK